MQYLSGGADSGFRHVTPEQYKARLLHVSGTRGRVTVREVAPMRKNVKDSDIFILDLGTNLIQWNGSGANLAEKSKAMTYLAELKGSRSHEEVKSVVVDGNGDDKEFWRRLDDVKVEDNDDDDDDDGAVKAGGDKTLFKLSDAGGKMEFKEVSTSSLDKSALDPADVFILDAVSSCFVWIGADASSNERKTAMSHAHQYLMGSDHPLVPISVFAQGKEDAAFKSCFQGF